MRGSPPDEWYRPLGGKIPFPSPSPERVVLRSANQNNNDCQWQSYHNSVARFHGCGWEPGSKTESFVEKIRGYLGNTIHPTAQNITVFQPHPPLRRHPLQAWRGEERALGGSPPVLQTTLKFRGIATPVCALVRNDMLFRGVCTAIITL